MAIAGLSLLAFRPVLCLVLFFCEGRVHVTPECASVGRAVQEFKVESRESEERAGESAKAGAAEQRPYKMPFVAAGRRR